jgi:hypothetical protein
MEKGNWGDKMFELKKIESAGYAQTMGGISFMFDVKVAEDRFSIDKGKTRINIIVPYDSEDKMIFNVVSKTIEENGKITFSGEMEKFTIEEKLYMNEWCEKNNLRDEGNRILIEYKNELENHFNLNDKFNKIINEETVKNLEYITDKSKRLKVVQNQLDESNQKLESLKNIQCD